MEAFVLPSAEAFYPGPLFVFRVKAMKAFVLRSAEA